MRTELLKCSGIPQTDECDSNPKPDDLNTFTFLKHHAFYKL